MGFECSNNIQRNPKKSTWEIYLDKIFLSHYIVIKHQVELVSKEIQ